MRHNLDLFNISSDKLKQFEEEYARTEADSWISYYDRTFKEPIKFKFYEVQSPYTNIYLTVYTDVVKMTMSLWHAEYAPILKKLWEESRGELKTIKLLIPSCETWMMLFDRIHPQLIRKYGILPTSHLFHHSSGPSFKINMIAFADIVSMFNNILINIDWKYARCAHIELLPAILVFIKIYWLYAADYMVDTYLSNDVKFNLEYR